MWCDVWAAPFNPRTYNGANVKQIMLFSTFLFLHAPMLGATSHIPFVRIDLFISIHAPMLGATLFGV